MLIPELSASCLNICAHFLSYRYIDMSGPKMIFKSLNAGLTWTQKATFFDGIYWNQVHAGQLALQKLCQLLCFFTSRKSPCATASKRRGTTFIHCG